MDHVDRVQVPFRFALAQDLLEDFLAVGTVQNREAVAQAAGFQFRFEDAQAQVVEGGDNQSPGQVAADQLLHPLLHFPGSLVGEGHRRDMAGRNTPFLDQPGDLAGDHAGFAGARTGQYQQGAVGVIHGFLLAGVEFAHGAPVTLGGEIGSP